MVKVLRGRTDALYTITLLVDEGELGHAGGSNCREAAWYIDFDELGINDAHRYEYYRLEVVGNM